MSGVFGSESELEGKKIEIFKDGRVKIGGMERPLVVTRPGESHKTKGGPLVYLVIKGKVVANDSV